jgi:hypothetical protein
MQGESDPVLLSSHFSCKIARQTISTFNLNFQGRSYDRLSTLVGRPFRKFVSLLSVHLPLGSPWADQRDAGRSAQWSGREQE